jgi:hypothetical protein
VGVVKCRDAAPNRATPLPNPPPQGGREQTECVAPLCINLTGMRVSKPAMFARAQMAFMIRTQAMPIIGPASA